MMDSMGEMGEPCSILISKSISSDVKPLKCRQMDLSLRKDVTHLQISGANPRDSIRAVSLLWFTLSKKPCKSNRSVPQTLLRAWAVSMSCVRHEPALIVEE
jgi:hypothetical protein